MRALFLFLALSTSSLTYSRDIVVHEHGYWVGTDAPSEHKTDFPLANAIGQFFNSVGANTVVDFGCGMGDYVKVMHYYQIHCEGFDGNPNTYNLTGGVGHVADLSQPLDLDQKYDWVLSLEVGEHLPKAYEKTFIENLDRHNTYGIVLSWAVKGQGGYGHFNEQNNDYVKDLLAQYGYINDIEAENELRRRSTFSWFKNTVMVFRRK